MSPGDGGDGVAEQFVEHIEYGDLIVQRFVDGPSGCGVGGASEGKPIGEEKSAGGGIAYVGSGIGASRNDVTVAIEKQRSVPIVGNLNQVGGAVAQSVGFCDDVGLRA